MRNKMLTGILLLACVLGCVSCGEAGKLALTLGDPWLGVKHNISNRVSSELRYVIDPDMSIISLRGSYNFFSKNKLTAFAGLEYGTISFRYDGILGDGSMITPFIGGGYALTEKIGISLDLGYSTINIKSGDFSVSGPEYVFNASISYFIW